MFLGIPRGAFYYDYYGFIQRLFQNSEVNIITGIENSDETLSRGAKTTVDEVCLPIKLTAGQVNILADGCDKVLVPRLAKDHRGRWLCPKQLGLPELMMGMEDRQKIITTDPIDFSNKKDTGKKLWKVCSELGMDRGRFHENFEDAYGYQQDISTGKRHMYVEAAWEFTPELKEGEIILPNIGKVLLLGHCYNVYDKYSNGGIFNRLDELGLDTVTERAVLQKDKERAVKDLKLLKSPFWESLVRTLGTAVCLKEQVEGIIYMSSFSCGPDAFIVEMIKHHIGDTPLMVLKLDEHKGNAGFETRLEAFADLLERRRAS